MVRTKVGSSEIGIYSCGRDTSPQPNANYIIDVSGLRDPQSNRGFRFTHADGRHVEVRAFVNEDSRMDAILEQVALLSYLNFDASQGGTSAEKWISFSFRDHHGKWISPAVAEIMADHLSNLGYNVSVHHFELQGEASK